MKDFPPPSIYKSLPSIHSSDITEPRPSSHSTKSKSSKPKSHAKSRSSHTSSLSSDSFSPLDLRHPSASLNPLISKLNINVHRDDAASDSDTVTTPVYSRTSYESSLAPRTLDDIRDQVAEKLAVRTIRKMKMVDGVRIAATLTLSKKDDAEFLRMIAGHLHRILLLKDYLFAIATTGIGQTSLIICGSSPVQVQRAALLSASKFVGRVHPMFDEGTRWIAGVREIGWTAYDESALWDVLSKSAQTLIDPLVPPPDSRSIAQILEQARARLQRISPSQAYAELHDTSIPMPVLLVDIRPEAQRLEHGQIQGSLIIERNVLEWRFDPRCLDGRLDIADRYDLRVQVMCQEGYTSSLAAVALQDLGLLNATDVVGGYKAWREAGLPVEVNPVWERVSTDDGGSLASGLGEEILRGDGFGSEVLEDAELGERLVSGEI